MPAISCCQAWFAVRKLASTGWGAGLVVPQEAVLIDGTKPSFGWWKTARHIAETYRKVVYAKAVWWLMAVFRKATRLS